MKMKRLIFLIDENLRIVWRIDINKFYREQTNARVRTKNESWIIKIEKDTKLEDKH